MTRVPLRVLSTAITSILLAVPASPAFAAEVPAGNGAPIQQGSPHPFACTDYTQGKVFIVSAAGKVEWEYPAKNCNDIWILPNGNLLFNTGHGAREVTRDKKIVWTFSDHQAMKTISSIYLLDTPGDATKWEIEH